MSSQSFFLRLFFQQQGLTSAAVLDELCTVFEPKEFSRHALFLKAGQVANEYLVLETGLLRAHVQNMNGDDVTTAFFTPGNVVLEAASFFQRKPSQESIEAVSDSTGWVVTFENLNHLFHAYPAFREAGRGILVRELAKLKERMISAISLTAEERYRNLLETAPDILQQAPLKHIASYLGVTDTSLSRIRKEILSSKQ